MTTFVLEDHKLMLPEKRKKRPVFKGQIVGPNGIDFYRNSEFNLPDGYIVWCHICGYEPSFKKTVIYIEEFDSSDMVTGTLLKDKNGKEYVELPGLGFKTWEDAQKHSAIYHDYRKVRVI